MAANMNQVVLEGRLTRDPDGALLAGRKSNGDCKEFSCGEPSKSKRTNRGNG